MTRKLALLAAFEARGTRGLTDAEARRSGGKNWRRHLAALVDEGYVFREDRSRYRRRGQSYVWRRVLLAHPAPDPPPPPAEVPMFDPPTTSALTGDVAA